MIDEKIEKLFSDTARVIGVIFFALGILSLFMGGVLPGLALSMVGGYIGFSYSGVLLDPTDKAVKEYTAIFGIYKSGKWKNYRH